MVTGTIRVLGPLMAILGLAVLPGASGSTGTGGTSTMIYIYDIGHQPASAADYDEIAAVVSLQGLINRDAPILYVNNDGYGRPAYWLEIMSRDGRWLEGRQRETLSGLDAVYRLAASRLKGAVIWDPDVPASLNVATTIAGVEDAVILSPELAERYLKPWSLPVVRDLRGMFTGQETGSKKNDAYRWAIREYISTGKCSPHFVCLYTDSYYDRQPGQIAYLIVRDWAVRNRAFTYDLSPWGDEVPGDDPGQPLGTDLATYKMLLAATLKQSAGKQMTEVAGFFNFQKYSNMPGHPSKHEAVPTEWETVYLISPYNCYQNTATEFCYNQSFHCQAPLRQLKQHRPAARRQVENTSYIAILMADYDSAYPLYHFCPKNWDDQARGELPLAWGINPNLIEVYPDLISYFYETATPRDNFVADASAAGYMNPNRVQKKYLRLFARHNQRFYRQTDMTISGMVLDWDQPRDDVKEAFTTFSPDGYATIVADLHGGLGKPPKPQLWKGMPIVNLLGADPNSAEHTAGEIYRAVKGRRKDEPGFYDFRCVWVTPTQVKAAIELFAKRHPEEPFEVVDIYTFFDLFRQHQERWLSEQQVIASLPLSTAYIEGHRLPIATQFTVQNATRKPLKAAFTVTGLADAILTPAKATLKPGKELAVLVSGNAIADRVTVEARGPFGARRSVMAVRAVPAREILGAIPEGVGLQFVSDLGADVLPHLTGEPVAHADGSIAWKAEAGVAKPGFLVYGPYAALTAGRYLALFRAQRTGAGAGAVARLDVCAGGKPIGTAPLTVSTNELPLGEYRAVALVFDYDYPGAAYESRAFWTGNASLLFDRVILWKIVE